MIKVEVEKGQLVTHQIMLAAKANSLTSPKEIKFILVSYDVKVRLLLMKPNLYYTAFDVYILPNGNVEVFGVTLLASNDLTENSCYLLT